LRNHREKRARHDLQKFFQGWPWNFSLAASFLEKHLNSMDGQLACMNVPNRSISPFAEIISRQEQPLESEPTVAKPTTQKNKLHARAASGPAARLPPS